MGNFSYDLVLGVMAQQIMEEQLQLPYVPEPDENDEAEKFKALRKKERKNYGSWLNQIRGWFYRRNYKREMK